MDACVSQDVRNTDPAKLVTIVSAAPGWVAWNAGVYNITASHDTFFSPPTGDGVGALLIQLLDGTILPLIIESVTSSTVATARSAVAIPAEVQNVATSQWAFATRAITGLAHLAGKSVSVFGDGAVIASPNNDAYTELVVSETGGLLLPHACAVVHVGLPYLCDVQTLGIESPQATQILSEKNISEIAFQVENTLGIFAGQEDPGDMEPLSKLEQADKPRHDFAFKASRATIAPFTGVMRGLVRSGWHTKGSVFMRKVDPVPWTLLSVHVPVTIDGGK
jgi:hypothetical protein